MRSIFFPAVIAIGLACSHIPHAHAGDVIRNYDADGNYTGYSEQETPIETHYRIQAETWALTHVNPYVYVSPIDACIKAATSIKAIAACR